MLACLNQNCMFGESRDCEQLEGIMATALSYKHKFCDCSVIYSCSVNRNLKNRYDSAVFNPELGKSWQS